MRLYFTLALLLCAGCSSPGLARDLTSEKRVFQCSEVDLMQTPVDTCVETSNGYLIRRFDAQGTLTGSLSLAANEVEIERLPSGGMIFKTKSFVNSANVTIAVKGHASSIFIESRDIKVNRPSGVICTI